MVPACHFAASQLASLPGPPFCSATEFRFAPDSGGFVAFWPVAVPPAATTDCFPDLHSPLGFLAPPDQSVQPDPLPVGPPSRFARSPFAPRGRSFFKCGYGSPFQVRYVSGGLLFLKPLGTFFTMIPNPFGVNDFLPLARPNPQDLFVFFRIGYEWYGVRFLWIKQRPKAVFYWSFRIMPFSVASHKFSSFPAKVTCRATAR